ncbi:S1-C subfamily serine protease [Chitinivorax tropicus]|uniref:S1-C subfamily serine protease n=1 Tax=Chitinivorax tropicus TaxID=714531 RepID=A0A840MNJ6_9PROT|nr:serine protease [Chitinivorax tropicus]MBB5018322.1 S1-C subfamily serine protease [Chitinivorax tropicus]
MTRHRHIRRTLLLGALCACVPTLTWGNGLPDIIDKIKPSIVAIGTHNPTRQPPLSIMGTGFVVADGNTIITNSHVIPRVVASDQQEKLGIVIRQDDRTIFREGTVLVQDPSHDLAVIKIAGSGLPTLALGDSDSIREGQRIAFTGYPIGMALGLHPATHLGYVSAISPIVLPAMNSRQLDPRVVNRLKQGSFNILQLDATAYPGNSGSPVFDPDTGKVIGIINMVFVKGTKEAALSAPSGISYAIPAKFIDELIREKVAKP